MYEVQGRRRRSIRVCLQGQAILTKRSPHLRFTAFYNSTPTWFYFIFKKILLIYFFSERGSEKERRGRKTPMCEISISWHSHTPTSNQACARLGIKPASSRCARQCPGHWTTPVRAQPSFKFDFLLLPKDALLDWSKSGIIHFASSSTTLPRIWTTNPSPPLSKTIQHLRPLPTSASAMKSSVIFP